MAAFCVTECLGFSAKHVLMYLSLHSLVSHSTAFTSSGSRQFCQTEVFEAACTHHDEIIFVEEALYGRMAIGRCVQTDYGNVGCQANVIRETDRRCSGKRICRITIPDVNFDKREPCPQEFKTYFQVAFKCLPVTVPDQPTSCIPDKLIEVNKQEGYLSSVTTDEQGYGSTTCPWKIKLPRGQRINITLIDFKTPEFDRRHQVRSSRFNDYGGLLGEEEEPECDYLYAILTERWSSDRTAKVCGGVDRERHVFLSRTSSVDVRIIASHSEQFGDENFFVLKFEAVGCADPLPPSDGWVDRKSENEAELGCNHSPTMWKHYCEDKKWTGPSHSCPPKREDIKAVRRQPSRNIMDANRMDSPATAPNGARKYGYSFSLNIWLLVLSGPAAFY